MFRLPGTPPEHKRHVLYEAGHFVAWTQLSKEPLNWFEQYLARSTLLQENNREREGPQAKRCNRRLTVAAKCELVLAPLAVDR